MALFGLFGGKKDKAPNGGTVESFDKLNTVTHAQQGTVIEDAIVLLQEMNVEQVTELQAAYAKAIEQDSLAEMKRLRETAERILRVAQIEQRLSLLESESLKAEYETQAQQLRGAYSQALAISESNSEESDRGLHLVYVKIRDLFASRLSDDAKRCLDLFYGPAAQGYAPRTIAVADAVMYRLDPPAANNDVKEAALEGLIRLQQAGRTLSIDTMNSMRKEELRKLRKSIEETMYTSEKENALRNISARLGSQISSLDEELE